MDSIFSRTDVLLVGSQHALHPNGFILLPIFVFHDCVDLMACIRRTAESTIAFACEGALCASHRGVLGILATQLTFTEVSLCDLAIDPSD